MGKIIERRYITPYDLRRMCIAEEWYTKGDNAQYDHMLNLARDKELTTALIAEIAADIQKHSAVHQSEEYLLNIMFRIAQASTTSFDIEE